jgi:hypothetical protein
MASRKIVLKFTTNPEGEPVNRFTENCCIAGKAVVTTDNMRQGQI